MHSARRVDNRFYLPVKGQDRIEKKLMRQFGIIRPQPAARRGSFRGALNNPA